MFAMESPHVEVNKEEKEYANAHDTTAVGDVVSVSEGHDLLAAQDVDPALNAKMHIVNNVRILRAPLFNPDLEPLLIF